MINFLTNIVPAIITLAIGIAAYRKNDMTMPLAIFLITYVGVII
jgi:hypothetical protein